MNHDANFFHFLSNRLLNFCIFATSGACVHTYKYIIESGRKSDSLIDFVPRSINLYVFVIIITCWIRYSPHRESWSDFLWSLSLSRLAILFDHMHPLSPSPFFFISFSTCFFHVHFVSFVSGSRNPKILSNLTKSN